VSFARPNLYLYQAIQLAVRAELAQARVFCDHFCSLQSFLEPPRKRFGSYGSTEIFFQETHAEYHSMAACQDEYCHQEPQGTEEFGVQKEQLSSWPPILYVPQMDLVITKEAPESLKIKLPNGTIVNMSIFSRGSTKEFLAHIAAILHFINQHGLNVQCRKLAKTVDKVARMLEKLQEAVGTKGTFPKDKMEPHKLEIGQTQEMLQEAQKLTTRELPRQTSF
jgi:hypothetical protein